METTTKTAAEIATLIEGYTVPEQPAILTTMDPQTGARSKKAPRIYVAVSPRNGVHGTPDGSYLVEVWSPDARPNNGAWGLLHDVKNDLRKATTFAGYRRSTPVGNWTYDHNGYASTNRINGGKFSWYIVPE